MGVPPGPQLVPALRWPGRCRSVTLARPPPVCPQVSSQLLGAREAHSFTPAPGPSPSSWMGSGPLAPASHSSSLIATGPCPRQPLLPPPGEHPAFGTHPLGCLPAVPSAPRPSCSLRRWCLASQRPLLPGPASPPWKALPASVATCSAFLSLSDLSSPSECVSLALSVFPRRSLSLSVSGSPSASVSGSVSARPHQLGGSSRRTELLCGACPPAARAPRRFLLSDLALQRSPLAPVLQRRNSSEP